MSHPLPVSVSVQSYHRWLHCPVGRLVVQGLVVLLTLHGVPLLDLSRIVRWQPPAWLTSQFPTDAQLGLEALPAWVRQWLGQQSAQAHGQAARISTIAPSCAQRGATVTITGTGFSTPNVKIYVGGHATGPGLITGGLRAPLVSASGNRVTFRVPLTAPGGVSRVWAVPPGRQAGVIAFRVRQPEVCGNCVDEDCDGRIEDRDVCVPVNHRPSAEAGWPQTAPVGTTVQLDGTGSSDVDGDLLRFQWTLSVPSGSRTTLSSVTSATPAFTIDQPGNYTAALRVSDRHLTSAPDTVLISTINSQPVAHAGADRGGQVGAVITLDGSKSSDGDGDALTYQWQLVSHPATSTATLADPSSVTSSFPLDVFGQYVVQLVVHDGTVASVADTVVIDTLNSPPVAAAGADTAGQVGQTLVLDGSGSSDVDGNALTYQWGLLSKPPGSTATLQHADTATPSFVIDRAGTYSAQLLVNDGLANSQPDTVTISTLNTKPVAQAGAAQSGTVGKIIHLEGAASSDGDGDSLTYQWSLLAQPATSTATLQAPTSVSPQFTLDQAGIYVAQLIVDDGTASSEPDTVTISTLNSQPVAQAGTDQSGKVGTLITLDGSGSSDVDGDSLSFVWTLSDKPAGSTASLSDPSAVQPTLVIDKPGNYTAQVMVDDGTVVSVPDTVTISTVNSKPRANPGPDQHGIVGSTLTLTGSGSSDGDGDPLTYQWSFTSVPLDSAATLSTPTSINTSFVLDKAGTYTVQLLVHDGMVLSDPALVTITTLNSQPVANAGTDQDVLTGTVVNLSGSGSRDVDKNALTYQWDLISQPATSTATLTNPTAAHPTFMPDIAGLYVVQLIVHDGTLDSDPDTVAITATTPDTTPPPPANLGFITTRSNGGQTTVTGAAGSVEGGAQVQVTTTTTNQHVTVTAHADGSFSATIGAQPGTTLTIQVTDSAGNRSVPITTQVEPLLPPDPATVAPPLDRTVATTVFDATAFLYTGSNPIQTGVAAGTIEAKRAAVIRGKVLKKDNSPLSGVTITVLNHPEFGQTLSRADGMFDMVVNGGGVLTFNYAKQGYLPAQRQIDALWQDYAFLPDVVLIQPDPQVTTIDLTDTTQAIQVAAGSSVTDADGTRQAVVMIPQGTTATMVLPDGSTQPLTTMNVRLTEYTVGANGPESMPGQLPPTSAYTYAVQLSADEALSAGATQVTFSQPLPVYVENFLNFPVGEVVPVGAYAQQRGLWLPEANGKVLKILSTSSGVADIDSNGDTLADDSATLAAVGITLAERQQLAQRYVAGRSLWRVGVTYFSQWDLNWPGGPPGDAIAPNGPPPGPGAGNDGDSSTLDTPQTKGGIAYQNQTLGQVYELTGAPFSFHYQSDRQRGRESAYTVDIPLSGPTIPASVQRVALTIVVAGREFRYSFLPQPNLTHTFLWDGLDAYGRRLQGRQQEVEARIEFTYPLIYQRAGQPATAFGQVSGVPLPAPAIRSESQVVVGRTWTGALGTWDAQALGLAGWSLDAQHGYDTTDHSLYFGDGTRRSGDDAQSENVGVGIFTTVGSGSSATFAGDGGPAASARLAGPQGAASSPDGSLYIADTGNHRIRRVSPSGTISTVAGGGVLGIVEGALATSVALANPTSVTVGPDGRWYFADWGLNRVFRVDTTGRITTVAGVANGVRGFSGDGGPATAAQLDFPLAVALGADGSLYLADSNNRRVRRVSPQGVISTVAGNGGIGASGDGGPATQAQIATVQEVAIGPDGSLYLASADRVRRVGLDGIIRRMAGGGTITTNGIPATQAQFSFIEGLLVTSDGTLYVTDALTDRIREVSPDGIITILAGSGIRGLSGDGGPPAAAQFSSPHGLVLGPEGTLYVADTNNQRIRGIRSVLPGFAGISDIVLVAKDGSEAYVFNSRGRHLRTVNTLTNSVIYQFGYDSSGKLITVTDANNNVTTITRDAAGTVTGITGPYGQSNNLTLDANGYLASITNPNSETTRFSYTAEGLLTSTTPPGKPASTFTYDSGGRLTATRDPAGGGDTLTRSSITNGYQVHHGTAAGEQTTYKVEYLPDGTQRRTNVLPDGTQQTTLIGTDGTQTVTQPDGITQTVSVTGDPRFGLQSPIPTSLNVSTPGGQTGTLTNSRTATLSDPNNPLSLTSQTDTVNFNGRTATRTYNATTRTAADTSPAGRKRTTVTDPQGRVTQQQQGTLAPTSFGYDARGRLASRSQGGRSATMTYDDLGRLGTITDSASRTVQFQYDAAGRVTQQTLPDNRVISYTYDSNGNVTAITPPGRPAHEFTYTTTNLEQSYLPPQTHPPTPDPRTLYSYDVDRKLTQITRPDGQQVQLNYDAAGRLSTQVFPSPEPLAPSTLSYSYNAQGNLSSASASFGDSVAYTYDGSLLLNSTWSGPVSGSVNWTYDNNYRKTSQSVNGGNTVNFTYDADDLLTGAGAMTLTRDSVNGLLSGTTVGTVTEALTYNNLGEVATAQASVGGSGVLNETYTRDSLGRISQKSETIQGVTTTYRYSYDVAGRLTTVTHNGATVSTYSYDSNGNRLTKIGTTGTQSGTYDEQDRLLTFNGNTYTYTANGELSSKTNTQHLTPSTYSYDALGNLRSATLSDGTQLGYVIDGENRRLGKQVNGSLVQGFLYENQLEPVAELDGNGNLVSRFVYCGCGVGNIPQYMVKGGVTYRIISDHLGSPRLVVDSTTGAVLQRMDYDEFGTVILDTNPGFQPFGFAGGIYDRDTGLVRFGARDYDAETGRWTAKDPIQFRGGDTNLYGYVASDPVNAIDPTGLETLINLLGSMNARSLLGPGLFAFITETISLAHQARIFASIGSAELIKRSAGLVQLGLSGGLQRAQTLFQALAGDSQEILTHGQVLVARFPTYTVILRTKSTFDSSVATLEVQFFGAAQKVQQAIKVRFFN